MSTGDSSSMRGSPLSSSRSKVSTRHRRRRQPRPAKKCYRSSQCNMHVSHPLIYDSTVEDREYQRSISRAVKDRNTLVVLPTALGKTIISALVVADLLYDYRDKRVLVMAPTRPLCVQHMFSFSKVLKLPEEDLVLLTGKTPADFREVTWNGKS